MVGVDLIIKSLGDPEVVEAADVDNNIGCAGV